MSGIELRIVDKSDSVGSDRTGKAYELYLTLIELMEQQPGKKAVVTFTSKTTGFKHQEKILNWAHADRYQLFASAVRGTTQREMYLEPLA